jgi:hypothetical protein
MKTFGEKAFHFFKNLNPDFLTPSSIELLLPFTNKEALSVARIFYNKFYNDFNSRTFIIGINPGRFGAGVTGISFTDPVRLLNDCGIENNFQKKAELSSIFIYDVINAFGGVNSFYEKFFVTAICPVGFTSEKKNLNYYDDKQLMENSRDFIKKSFLNQLKFGADRSVAICLGEGKNYKYLQNLNNELSLFREIIPLAHPRFILQYKRKKMDYYKDLYLKALTTSMLKNKQK